ncbi:MAG: TlpA family protein disulfide reductase [Chloroflexales bacterium]|nr:TlpA family protein disulfide reductase [Chloroflexales bacterium]
MQQLDQQAPQRQPARPQRGRAVAGPRTAASLLRRPWLIGALGLLVVVALAAGITRGQPAVSATAAPEVDHPAPAFTLSTPDGAAVSLADLRGQVVLVNFWATWCPPCRAEMPAIQSAYERYHDKGFTVLAVTADEDLPAVRAFFRQRGLAFPALLDPQGVVHAAYRANTLPSSFFVDREGVIRAVYHGPMSEAVIDGQLANLLQ